MILEKWKFRILFIMSLFALHTQAEFRCGSYAQLAVKDVRDKVKNQAQDFVVDALQAIFFVDCHSKIEQKQESFTEVETTAWLSLATVNTNLVTSDVTREALLRLSRKLWRVLERLDEIEKGKGSEAAMARELLLKVETNIGLLYE